MTEIEKAIEYLRLEAVKCQLKSQRFGDKHTWQAAVLVDAAIAIGNDRHLEIERDAAIKCMEAGK